MNALKELKGEQDGLLNDKMKEREVERFIVNYSRQLAKR